jgi:fructose-1,6-bisphosphatase/inositol monophosphatase family enzyme
MNGKISEDNQSFLIESLRRLHELIRETVVTACEQSAVESMAAVEREEEGDTIYAVDKISEEVLIDFCEREIAPKLPLILIAEGLRDGRLNLPRGISESDAVIRIIFDPIDGTRCLMYQKRSGWVLTGVAPNRGPQTNLSDVELAIQTEIPLVKQHLSDCVWATVGKGVQAERFNRLNGSSARIALQPTRAASILHGYAEVSRFFPGARDELARIDDEIVLGALGPISPGKAHCFEDQYASTGGQLYELMSGRDRFVCDLRPLMEKLLNDRGAVLGICCHPYDLCTELIAREAGVIVTDLKGEQLTSPLTVEANVGWAGYANKAIRAQIEPLLQTALRSRGLI